MHLAASRSLELVELLLAAGAGVDETDGRGQTPLFSACRSDFAQMGAESSSRAQGYPARTLLPTVGDRADSPGCPEIVAALLGARASVATSDHGGQTALHLAASAGCSASVAQLLHARAHVDARDSREETALHCAARRGSPTVVQALTDARADPTLLNTGGQTPEALATAAVRRLLRLQGGDPLLLTITGPGGPRCSLQGNTGWDILKAKEVISEELGIPVGKQVLLHGVQRLRRDQLLGALLAGPLSESLALTLVVTDQEEVEEPLAFQRLFADFARR